MSAVREALNQIESMRASKEEGSLFPVQGRGTHVLMRGEVGKEPSPIRANTGLILRN